MPAPLSRLSARAALRLRNEPMSPSPSARRLSARAIHKIDSPRQWHPPCVRGTGTQHHDGRRLQLSGRVPRLESSSLTLYHEIHHHHHRRARRF